MTFSISLPIVLRRMMGLNALGELYDILLGFGIMSGAVHTRVEVRKMDSEMSRLIERPWLQLMYCAVCLLCGHNFR